MMILPQKGELTGTETAYTCPSLTPTVIGTAVWGQGLLARVLPLAHLLVVG